MTTPTQSTTPSPSPAAQSQPQTIDLQTLPTQTLTSIKNQLTTELNHLTTSHTQLKTAQSKFRDCGTSITSTFLTPHKTQTTPTPTPTPLLVPLTPSLYVPGTLASTTTVLIDIGTGFYVEKSPGDAKEFYARKVEEVGGNLGELERIVKGKQGNLGVVEDVLRQKVIAENSKGGGEEAST